MAEHTLNNIAGPYLFARSAFPITITAYYYEGGGVAWSQTLEEPDSLALMRVPGRAELGGRKIGRVTILDARGNLTESST